MAESSFGRAGECRETCASLTAREGGAQGAVVRRHVGTSARRGGVQTSTAARRPPVSWLLTKVQRHLVEKKVFKKWCWNH